MSFLTRPLELLTPAGELVAAAEVPAWAPRRVLLSRGLCSYSYMDTTGMGRAEGRAAARLRARAAAPYADPGLLVRRAGSGYGLWWWDASAARARLAERSGPAAAGLQPETLAQPPGEGWRVVALTVGFEAQLWREGALVASQWRRLPFDARGWAAFVRAAGREAPAAPADPPEVVRLPVSLAGLLAADGIWGDLGPGDLLKGAAAVALAALIGVASFDLGFGLKYRRMAEAAEADAARLAAAPAPPGTERTREALRRLAAYRALAGGAPPVARLATALRTLAQDRITPQGFELDGSRLVVDLPYTDLERIGPALGRLEAAGFADIRPVTDPALKLVHLQMTTPASR